MKRNERTTLNQLRKTVNADTIYCEIPTSYTDEAKQAMHELLTIEKNMLARRINWNPVLNEYTILYSPASSADRAEKERQERETLETIAADLKVTDTYWNGFRKPETDPEPEPETPAVKRTSYDLKRVFDQVDEAIRTDRSAYHAPRGNSKTGDIPAWNQVPGRTCSPEACAHCLREGCYALKNMLRAGYDINRNRVFASWTENTALAMNHLDDLEAKLEEYFSGINSPRFFRIHAAGDFHSIEYGAMWYRIAKRHPGTRFLAFTKQWDVARAVKFDQLDNFSLVLSGWTGVKIPEDLRVRYRCAWCDDGHDDRIPADALECPGNCETCGMCWKLAELGRDTYFHKH